MSKSDNLLQMLRDGAPLSGGNRVRLVYLLSVPAILSQLVTIVMQYIDAMMVGSLGAEASASIGLVSTTTWLFGGLCGAAANGFSVQVAHLIGAGEFRNARGVLRQAIGALSIYSAVVATLGICISPWLPQWLGGGADITGDASIYFLVFSIGLPVAQCNILAAGMLRCSGNIKVPSILSALMCVLDVIFNYFLIFPSRIVEVLGAAVEMPGAGLGVLGAALGTFLAHVLVAAAMMYFVCCRSQHLRIVGEKGVFRPTLAVVRKALKIALPMGVQHSLICGAQIVITTIVAPLGTVAIAANSFGIIIESLCYMPGYGFGDAATTLVGQSLGARRSELAGSFARICVASGVMVMTVMAVIMYAFSPELMSIMTPDLQVQALATEVLRIEAFAEPMFGAAIVSCGAFVGAGDTLRPCIINLSCIWVVRITLSLAMVGSMGLVGVWIAMCVELCVRGAVFLLRLFFGNWQREFFLQNASPRS